MLKSVAYVSFALVMNECLTSASAAQSNIQQEAAISAVKDRGGFFRENWSGLFSGFARLVNTNDQGSFSLHPTVWSLVNLSRAFTRKDTNIVSEEYQREAFLRNLRLDVSLTPTNASKFKIATSQIGFTYAVLNNNELSSEDYRSLSDIQDTYTPIAVYIAGYQSRHNSEFSCIDKFQSITPPDTIFLSDELKDSVRSKFHIDGDLLAGITPFPSMRARMTKILESKALLTFSLSHEYDYHDAHTTAVTLGSHLLFPFWMGETLIPLDFELTGTFADDTTESKSNLDRQTIAIVFGKQFQPLSWLEISPSFSLKTILNHQYSEEKHTSVQLSVTPRVRVTESVWLPITLSLDTNEPRFFGFLSVQYSI